MLTLNAETVARPHQPPITRFRVFLAQRAAALKVGLLGAYFGRALMLLMATFVIQNLWLRMLGAFYLFKISVAHLGINPFAKGKVDEEESGDAAGQVAGKGFWYTVLLVELVDIPTAGPAIRDHLVQPILRHLPLQLPCWEVQIPTT